MHPIAQRSAILISGVTHSHRRTDGRRIVLRPQDQFRRSVPDRHNNLIPTKQSSLREGLVP
jgi:hypothetical protein